MISTRGRYALRLMLDLAAREGDGWTSLGDISGRTGVSLKYLEAIVSLLSRGGVLSSKRGKDGGYRLARPASEITAGQIVELTEGSLAPVACLENANNPCERAGRCLTLPMWRGLDSLISDYLERITLRDLLDGNIE